MCVLKEKEVIFIIDTVDDVARKIKNVYSSLGDEVSKVIFNSRLLYFLSGDKIHLRCMLDLIDQLSDKKHNTIIDFINTKELHKNKIIAYGTGYICGGVVDMLAESNINVLFLCDSDKGKQGSTYFDLQVISPEELVENHKDAIIVISSVIFAEEIFNKLISMGFSPEKIYVPDNFNDMYFGEEYLRSVENEVYIDAGAYNGDTIKRFLKFCDKKFKKIYAFEPDPNNYKVLEDNIRKECINNVHLIKKGTWNKSDTLYFSLSGMGSKIKETGASSVDVVTIDEVVNDDVVTFIKMDIEGAELCSLQGARETIQRDKPRLAISVYHKPEDILAIPLYIHSLVHEYRFFLRHHTTGLDYYDTVVYAVLN